MPWFLPFYIYLAILRIDSFLAKTHCCRHSKEGSRFTQACMHTKFQGLTGFKERCELHGFLSQILEFVSRFLVSIRLGLFTGSVSSRRNDSDEYMNQTTCLVLRRPQVILPGQRQELRHLREEWNASFTGERDRTGTKGASQEPQLVCAPSLRYSPSLSLSLLLFLSLNKDTRWRTDTPSNDLSCAS